MSIDRFDLDWGSCDTDTRDSRAGSLPHVQVPLRGQLRVRVDDQPARHSELRSKRACRWELLAGAEAAAADLIPEPVLDLPSDWLPTVAVDERQQQLEGLTGHLQLEKTGSSIRPV